MAKASDNEFPSVLMAEQAGAPDAPAVATYRIYIKADGKLYIVDSDGNETEAGIAAETPLPPLAFFGLSLANNGGDANNDIDIGVGGCRDDGNAYNLRLATALTKRLDASWAAGTNQGGLDTGAKGASTWYHIYLIRKDADGTIDVLFTATFGSPTMPAGYSNKRHIGSVKTNASSNIRPFLQTGNIVRWNDSTLTLDVDVTNLGTGSTSYTLAFIPTGLKVRALLHGYNWINADSRNILVRDPDTVDVAPSASVWPIANLAGPAASAVGYGELRIVTNTSAQVAARSSGANTYFRLAVMGWEYLRQV